MIRYYGLYAKEYIHSSKLYRLDSATRKHFRKKYSHWRARLLLAFGIDPLRCLCGHTMVLVKIVHPGKNIFLDNLPSQFYNSS